MEYVTIRDLRLKPAEVWEKLRRQRELILTSNGRPVAVISDANEENVEETVAALRRARAQAAVSRMRRAAAESGLDRLSSEEIDAEIAAVRGERKARLADTARE
jgi:prevent-host-death family protein